MARPDLEAIRTRLDEIASLPEYTSIYQIRDVTAYAIPAVLAYIAELEDIARDVAAVMGGPLDDAHLHIQEARDVNRKERPYSERLDIALVDALEHIRDMQERARALSIPSAK